MSKLSNAVALIVLLCSMGSAQTQTTTQHVDAPFNGVFSSGCSEDVAVSGFVHGVIHITSSDNSITIFTHVGPRNDVRAVGLTTGTQFQVNGITRTKIQTNANIQSFTYNNNFKVVGLYTVHYNFHLMFDGSADPKAFVNNFRVTCN